MSETNLQQDQVRQLVQRHTDTQSQIHSEKSRIADLVNSTTSTNKGAIFDALRKAHEFWDMNLKEIQDQFDAMTQQVQNTAQRFGTTDEDGGQRLQKVGMLAPGEMSALG